MASKSFILDSLLNECGKDSPQVREQMSEKIGEITLELLSRNDGKFFGLKKVTTLSITADETTQFKLPADYHTISIDSCEVNVTTGAYIQDIHVLEKSDIRQRIRDRAHYDCHYGYIEKLEAGPTGRGYYLTLAVASTKVRSFEIEYFRRPTENDTDVISEYTLIERGVRAQYPSLFKTAKVDRAIYLNRLPRFVEKRRRNVTDSYVLPPKRIQRHNRNQHKRGAGL